MSQPSARLQQVTNGVNGAYTRFEYPASGLYLGQFSTIQNGLGEAGSWNHFDGAGRVRAFSADLPASAGGYIGRYTEYDVMGRLKKQSNPLEINGVWTPQGDDNGAAWLWTMQAYDWKGRPTLTTNTDGTTRENIYGGCGCAGGEVATVRDEAGRRRRMTMDVLGRLWKVEELKFDQSLYSTRPIPTTCATRCLVLTMPARSAVSNTTVMAGCGARQPRSREPVPTRTGKTIL